MNRVILSGRLTKDAETRYSTEGNAVSRFTTAANRRYNKKEGSQTADYVSCVAFGKTAEFFEKFGKKGVKFILEGRIQTGSYEKDGTRIYTSDVVVESAEFAEKKSDHGSSEAKPAPVDENGFMNIPDGIDEELPFV